MKKLYFLFLLLWVSTAFAQDIRPDVLERRDYVIYDYIWKAGDIPTIEVEYNISDLIYADVDRLGRIDKLIVQMDNGFSSTVYHFRSRLGNNRLIIYHQGHGGHFNIGKDTIIFFIEHGYDVLAFAMPLRDPNPHPVVVNIPGFGDITIANHPDFHFMEILGISPIKYFLEPVGMGVNYVKENYDYDLIAMIGISGGGWTTTVYSALDSRIDKSYPVAGSLPMRYRNMENGTRHLGDYEQSVPELYSILNCTEQYFLGAQGGRRQLQILNKYDPCCFQPPANYQEEVVQQIKDELRRRWDTGQFDLFIDDTHSSHMISPTALNVILQDLEQ